MLRTGLEVPTLLLTWLLAVTSSRLVLGYSNASTPLLDLSVLEELPADELVGSVPQDDDQASGHLRYSLLSRPTAPDGSVPTRPLFTVDERRGTIRTAQRLDRDALCRRTVDHDSCYIRFDVAVRPTTNRK